MLPLNGPESRQNLLWFSVSLGFLALLWLLTPVLTPFVAAFIIGYVLNPGVDWLQQRGLPRAVAVVLAMLSVFVIVTALALIVLPILSEELPVLRERLPALLLKIDAAFGPTLRQWGIGGHLDFIALQKAIAAKLAAGDGSAAALLNWLRIGGSALIAWIGTLLLIPIVLFYLLLDWHRVIQRIGETVPRRWYARVAEMAAETDALLAQYLRGQLLVMFLLAAYYSTALSLAGFDVALPVGMLTGLLVFIPYVGFGLGLVLAIIAAVLQFEGWEIGRAHV